MVELSGVGWCLELPLCQSDEFLKHIVILSRQKFQTFFTAVVVGVGGWCDCIQLVQASECLFITLTWLSSSPFLTCATVKTLVRKHKQRRKLWSLATLTRQLQFTASELTEERQDAESMMMSVKDGTGLNILEYAENGRQAFRWRRTVVRWHSLMRLTTGQKGTGYCAPPERRRGAHVPLCPGHWGI